MQRFRPGALMELASMEGRLGVLTDEAGDSGPLTEDGRFVIKSLTQRLEKDLSNLGLVASFATLRRLRLLGEEPEGTFNQLTDLLKELQGRVEDETGGILFLSIDPSKNRLYLGTNLFGNAVAEHFPATIGDIEEAGKCLALDRGTACVFHLMRVMEAGLKQLAADLGIPYAPSWESYITQINARIAKKHKKKGIQWKRDEQYFKDIAGDLLTVKVAWRNPTMHIVRTYTPEEAGQVFTAVRSLMQRITKRAAAKAATKAAPRLKHGGLRIEGTGTVTPPEA